MTLGGWQESGNSRMGTHGDGWGWHDDDDDYNNRDFRGLKIAARAFARPDTQRYQILSVWTSIYDQRYNCISAEYYRNVNNASFMTISSSFFLYVKCLSFRKMFWTFKKYDEGGRKIKRSKRKTHLYRFYRQIWGHWTWRLDSSSTRWSFAVPRNNSRRCPHGPSPESRRQLRQEQLLWTPLEVSCWIANALAVDCIKSTVSLKQSRRDFKQSFNVI